MNRHRTLAQWICTFGLLAALALTAACSTPATPTQPPPATVAATDVPPTAIPPTAAPTEAPTEAAEEPGLVPATAACESLEPAVFKALGVEVEVAEVPFTDPLSDKAGTACELLVKDTGEFFESVDVVMEALQLVFESHGWTEDNHYVADGPTGTARGFRQDDALAIVSVQWEPSPDADCPDDVIISECDLEPEQMLFTVSIQCVQGL